MSKKSLSQFLETASVIDTEALVEARAFSEQVLKPIDERMMIEAGVN
jgi:hypothetical protein